MAKRKFREILESENTKLLGAHFTFSGCPYVELNISGNCPVQAFGHISDIADHFYFRARHDNWSFEVYDGDNKSEIIYVINGGYINSSWMPIDVALRIIGRQILVFWKEQGAYRRISQVFGEDILKKFKKEYRKKATNGKEKVQQKTV